MSVYVEHWHKPFFGLSMSPPICGSYRLILFSHNGVADFGPTYLNDSPVELIRAVLEVTAKDDQGQSAVASFSNEPGSFGIGLTRKGKLVRIELTFTEAHEFGLTAEQFNEAIKSEGCLRCFEMDYRFLGWALKCEFSDIREILGPDRYRDEWHFEFPEDEFVTLKRRVATWIKGGYNPHE